MTSNAIFAEIAALAGDPARAGMLHALMDGRALTASELARVAGIAPQTASGHLTRLTAAGLLSVEKQGRHRYHRLASPGVARMMESIMQVASDLEPPRKRLTVGPREAALRRARTCYDHLAGELGVALTDALVAGSYAELTNEAGLITDSGIDFLVRIGVDLDTLLARRTKRSQRVLCRPCLDWSERRWHLAGALGATICTHSFANGWIRRVDGTRAVLITPKGLRVFREQFGASLE
jgi:DNA-binding transcriptional ArsR family regulator